MKKKPRISLTVANDFNELEISQGPCWVVGVDEVGAGCLAGPLFCAAVGFRVEENLKISYKVPENCYVHDSKKLNSKERASLSDFVQKEKSLLKSLILVSVETIDTVNIYQARLAALADALLGVMEQIETLCSQPEKILFAIDGDRVPVKLESMLNKDPQRLMARAFVKGDSRLSSIAMAASYAKYSRDTFMAELSKEYPVYRWEKNAGYATPEHKSLMRVHGMSPHHRRSFCRFMNLQEEVLSQPELSL